MLVLAESRLDVARVDAALLQALAPETERPAGTENDVVTTCPAPLAPTRTPLPVRERRPDRARRAALGAVVEVIDVVVVEVDRLLDESQAEAVEAEVQIGLRVVDRRRHMVQAENRMDHPLMLSRHALDGRDRDGRREILRGHRLLLDLRHDVQPGEDHAEGRRALGVVEA